MGHHRSNSNSDEPISEINIVPFVDILLVILIIFMVTAPIAMQPSLKIQLPEAASSDKTEFTPFQIVVQSRNAITLNGKPVAFEQLRALAESYKNENPMGQAVISADESVPHGDVISILDQVKLGGIQRLALSTQSK